MASTDGGMGSGSAPGVKSGMAVATQIAVFPLFGLAVTLGDNLAIGGIFTAVSLVRAYLLRRLFERLR